MEKDTEEPVVAPTNQKQEFYQLVADGRLREVLDQLLLETSEQPALHREVILQSQRYSAYERDVRMGTEDYDDLNRTSARITEAVLELIEELPGPDGEQRKRVSKKQEISEKSLKFHLLLLLLGSKLAVIFWLWIQWETGGFTTDQFISTLSLLVPVFATYTGLMIKDLFNQQKNNGNGRTDRYLPRSLQWTGYIVCALYLLVICFIIGLPPQGKLSYQQMTGMLALAESALGMYVGTIVFSLFKRGKGVNGY